MIRAIKRLDNHDTFSAGVSIRTFGRFTWAGSSNDWVVACHPARMAKHGAQWQHVREAMKDMTSMERLNRYKRPARFKLTDKDARMMRTSSGDCAKLQ